MVAGKKIKANDKKEKQGSRQSKAANVMEPQKEANATVQVDPTPVKTRTCVSVPPAGNGRVPSGKPM